MTEYTKKLDEMKAGHNKKVEAIRADGDLKPEARDRRLSEEKQRFEKEYAAEKERAFSELDSDIEQNWRRANAAQKPRYSSSEEETAAELRLSRIREEVRDEFEAGRQDPIRAYQHAIRLGDKERAEVIGKVGTRYLENAIRRQQLARLVEENEPESKKRAKKRLSELEEQKRQTGLGLALQERARAGRR